MSDDEERSCRVLDADWTGLDARVQHTGSSLRLYPAMLSQLYDHLL